MLLLFEPWELREHVDIGLTPVISNSLKIIKTIPVNRHGSLFQVPLIYL